MTRRRLAPERGPDGNFTAPGRGARQKKIGHVRAGDQEHEHHGAEQDDQRRPHIPDHIGMQRHDGHRREIHVRVGVLLRQPSGDRAQFRFRLSDLHSRFQPADHAEKMRPAIV